MTLEALASRAVEGDRAALGELCEALTTPIFRLCLRMLGNRADAEDATQDVLVKVVTHLGDFEARSGLMTWVHRIAVRHVLAFKKKEAPALDEAGFSRLLDQGLAYGATQPAPSMEDLVLRKEVCLSCTQGMLMMLSLEDRLALVLVELLGFDGVEAALIAEVEPDAFRQRLTRARARLSSFLQSTCGLANEDARCRCERQLAALKTRGLSQTTQQWAPLSEGPLESRVEVAQAQSEIRHIRVIAASFQAHGQLRSPASLRSRIAALMPTVLVQR